MANSWARHACARCKYISCTTHAAGQARYVWVPQMRIMHNACSWTGTVCMGAPASMHSQLSALVRQCRLVCTAVSQLHDRQGKGCMYCWVCCSTVMQQPDKAIPQRAVPHWQCRERRTADPWAGGLPRRRTCQLAALCACLLQKYRANQAHQQHCERQASKLPTCLLAALRAFHTGKICLHASTSKQLPRYLGLGILRQVTLDRTSAVLHRHLLSSTPPTH